MLPALVKIVTFSPDFIEEKPWAHSLLVMQAAKIISSQGGCCEL
jgi:hypothetical protein